MTDAQPSTSNLQTVTIVQPSRGVAPQMVLMGVV